MTYNLEVVSTASEGAVLLGPSFESSCSIYSSPAFWRAVEEMRPEVDIRYLTVRAEGRCAMIPAYLYPSGRSGNRYSPDMDTKPGEWPATEAAGRWALLGGCSGRHSGFAFSGSWSMQEAASALLPPAIAYLQENKFNVVMKFFDGRLRSCVAEAVGLSTELMPLLDAHAILHVRAGNIEEYISALPAPFRGFVRRDLRRFSNAGLALEKTDLEAVIDELPRLWDQVQVYHGSTPNLPLCRTMLECQSKALNGLSHVFCARDKEGQAVAMSLNYRFRNSMCCRLIGLEYDKAIASGAYFKVMYYEPLLWGYAHQIDTLFLGILALKAKVMRGADLEPLYALYIGADGRTLSQPTAKYCQETARLSLSAAFKGVSSKAFHRPEFLLEETHANR